MVFHKPMKQGNLFGKIAQRESGICSELLEERLWELEEDGAGRCGQIRVRVASMVK